MSSLRSSEQKAQLATTIAPGLPKFGYPWGTFNVPVKRFAPIIVTWVVTQGADNVDNLTRRLASCMPPAEHTSRGRQLAEWILQRTEEQLSAPRNNQMPPPASQQTVYQQGASLHNSQISPPASRQAAYQPGAALSNTQPAVVLPHNDWQRQPRNQDQDKGDTPQGQSDSLPGASVPSQADIDTLRQTLRQIKGCGMCMQARRSSCDYMHRREQAEQEMAQARQNGLEPKPVEILCQNCRFEGTAKTKCSEAAGSLADIIYQQATAGQTLKPKPHELLAGMPDAYVPEGWSGTRATDADDDIISQHVEDYPFMYVSRPAPKVPQVVGTKRTYNQAQVASVQPQRYTPPPPPPAPHVYSYFPLWTGQPPVLVYPVPPPYVQNYGGPQQQPSDAGGMQHKPRHRRYPPMVPAKPVARRDPHDSARPMQFPTQDGRVGETRFGQFQAPPQAMHGSLDIRDSNIPPMLPGPAHPRPAHQDDHEA